ncbi:MAG: M67 family metallopeptidase [Acidobacteriota bacterium]
MIYFTEKLFNRLISLCKKALPKKAYGLIAGRKEYIAEEIYPLTTNLRLTDTDVNSFFKSYGEFYHERDRGFLIDKKEQARVMEKIARKNQQIVAIYHSHRCLYATPTKIDMDLHFDPDVPAIIVSLVEKDKPEVRAFRIKNSGYEELEIRIIPPTKKKLTIKFI